MFSKFAFWFCKGLCQHFSLSVQWCYLIFCLTICLLGWALESLWIMLLLCSRHWLWRLSALHNIIRKCFSVLLRTFTTSVKPLGLTEHIVPPFLRGIQRQGNLVNSLFGSNGYLLLIPCISLKWHGHWAIPVASPILLYIRDTFFPRFMSCILFKKVLECYRRAIKDQNEWC